MSVPSPFKHYGLSVRLDELIPDDTIEMRSSVWAKLHESTITAHGLEDVDDAANDTRLNASVVGPLDGPDAGTGPLTPVKRNTVNRGAGNVKLPASEYDTRPNILSPIQEKAQDLHAGAPLEDQGPTPYPVGDLPSVPTSAEPNPAGPTIPAEEQVRLHEAKVREDGPDELPEENNNEQYSPDVEPVKRGRKRKAESELPEHPAVEAQPPAEVFADSDGKTIGIEDGKGGFEHVRDNPFPPDHAHGDLTGKSIKDHV